MELQQIKYFRVIARTENISRAAEQLFIAQPSLSQMLKRLEEEVGLFYRLFIVCMIQSGIYGNIGADRCSGKD